MFPMISAVRVAALPALARTTLRGMCGLAFIVLSVSGVAQTPSPAPSPGLPPSALANISTRLRVETDDSVLIGGFIVTGTQPKRVIVRAIGPSLPLGDTLSDPFLELRDSTGALIRFNDNWRSDQEAEIIATTLPPADDRESAIIETLPANGASYTAIVHGVNNATGIALVEVYDLDVCGLQIYAALSPPIQPNKQLTTRAPTIESRASDPSKQKSAFQLPSSRYQLHLDMSNLTYTLPILDQKIIQTGAPNQIGVTRPVDLSPARIGTTFTNPDGTQLLVFAIRSPGATRLRVQFDSFELPAGDEVYLHAPFDNTTFAGPYRSTGPWGDRSFWSGSIEGDTVIIEYHFRSTPGSLRIPEVAHIYSDLGRRRTDPTPEVLTCELDASCYEDSNKNAVGRIIFIRSGGVYLCTGTLLNNTANDHIPYFLTANHCVPAQSVAQTVETYWLYQTTACNSGVLRDGMGHSPNGATLLVARSSYDFALLRLVDTPPSGVAFASWTSSVIPTGTTVYGFHHPGPDIPPELDSYLRRAEGSIFNTSIPCGDTGLQSGYQVNWASGLVEFGSSGSGLWRDRDLIGVSSCINSNLSCSNRHALYSKFSDFYPLLQPYLDGYYNYYTITTMSSPEEGGMTSGDGKFLAGSMRTISASPNSGYTFVNWTEGATVVSTSPNYTFTLYNDRDFCANFLAFPTFTISTSSSPVGGGAATGSGIYPAGSERTVTAIPNCGYEFVSWTENESVVSTSASYAFTLTSDRNLVALFTALPNPTPPPAMLANISTRGLVQTGNNVLIAGTIVLGEASRRVIVRAIGPSLNLPGQLTDPTLELRNGNGTLIRSNDNWRTDQETEILATTIPPTNDLEAAIVETLPASGASYTAIVSGVGGTSGIAVVEVYALN